MKTISAALKAHLAQQYHTLATCWLAVLTNGTVLGFTDHDRDLAFDLEQAMIDVGLTPGPGIESTGSIVYAAATGFTASNIQTGQGLNVDTGEAQGILSSPAITEADLRAGIWDHAALTIFKVNWADLMGALIERHGHLGEVTIENGVFKAEWRGLAQAYQAMIGELTSPLCGAVLGDARCTKDLTAFTVTGTIDSVGADNMTIFDAARTEPGPTAGVAVTGITNANPGIVTLAAACPVDSDDPIVIYGVTGMTPVNTATIAKNVSGNAFELPVDTSDVTSYPPYVSGGQVAALGGGSGYFDSGFMIFTSGANAGLSMEVRSYRPGQWILQLPMPYPIAAGDTYAMKAGCDHAFATCRDKFDNAVNFRGFPYLPGIDQLIQVGHHG